MTLSKLKKYVGKNVRVHFRHSRRTENGIIEYRPKDPICNYYLYQPQYFGASFYICLNPKRIGHIETIGE